MKIASSLSKIFEEELSSFKPPTVSEWADTYRILSEASEASGKWKTSKTPYLRDIMDSFCDDKVKEVTFMSSTQVGKTEAILNMIAYAIANDPSETLIVMPTEKDLKKISSSRIIPMILSCPQLKKYVAKKTDINKNMYRFSCGMHLFFGWSNSPSSLSSSSVRYLFMDELDKYPAASGKEGNPIKLARERTRTFWNSKVIKTSTPTTKSGYIYTEFQKSQRHFYKVPCPHCGEYFSFEMENLKWSKKASPEEILEKKLAYYECHFCKEKIVDIHKVKMLAKGKWETKDEPSSHKGFFLNCFNSPWLTYSEIAHEFLTSKGEQHEIQNFVNSWLAKPYRKISQETKIEDLRKLRREYSFGKVAEDVKILTAGVDCQKHSFYFVIRGWDLTGKSWLVTAQHVLTFDELDVAMRQEYSKESGEIMKVRKVFIDSGYNASTVYEICKLGRRLYIPIKGRASLSTGIPVKKTAIKGGMRLSLYSLDTYFFKDKIKANMSDHEDFGNRFFFPSNVPLEYLSQLVSEQKVFKEGSISTGKHQYKWEKLEGDNHYFDCEVYAMACAYALKVFQYAKKNTKNISK